MEDIDFVPSVWQKASQKPIVEQFIIEGLYGYKTLSLETNYAATILIARNGSGKTTLLATLDSFLRCQFSRLINLQFDMIRCRLRDAAEEITLTQSAVKDFCRISPDTEIASIARRSELSAMSVFKFILEDMEELEDSYAALTENDEFSAIYRTVGSYNFEETRRICTELRSAIIGSSPQISSITKTIKECLSDIDILYLPTYRRVELSLTSENKDRPKSRSRRPKLRLASDGLFSPEIQFGLSDISERLSQLNQLILQRSNLGYRSLTADIIQEQLDGTFDTSDFFDKEIPSKDDLELLLSRIKEAERIRPFQRNTIPDLSKIYEGNDLLIRSNKFLRYFLAKLNSVIQETKDIESTISDFILLCNRYLSGTDPLLFPDAEIINSTKMDRKELTLDRRNLKIYVESIPRGRRMSIDALSSGEKQMVSIFAKLLLFKKDKLVLIDEPELSLSLDWQRQILVDLLNTPLCKQVVAITHSPFVFDNALEPFARALDLDVSPPGISDLFAHFPDDEEGNLND